MKSDITADPLHELIYNTTKNLIDTDMLIVIFKECRNNVLNATLSASLMPSTVTVIYNNQTTKRVFMMLRLKCLRQE